MGSLPCSSLKLLYCHLLCGWTCISLCSSVLCNACWALNLEEKHSEDMIMILPTIFFFYCLCLLLSVFFSCQPDLLSVSFVSQYRMSLVMYGFPFAAAWRSRDLCMIDILRRTQGYSWQPHAKSLLLYMKPSASEACALLPVIFIS